MVVIGLISSLAILIFSTGAFAHPHQVTTENGDTVMLANGQNHPGFVFNAETGLYESCEGVNEPANAGPAGYGLETAHHGRDRGTPGKADGCFAITGSPTDPAQDHNPAID